MQTEVKDALYRRAQGVAFALKDLGYGYQFDNFNGTFSGHDFPRTGHVRFFINGRDTVEFYDVSPKDVTRQIIHPPVTTGSEKLDVSSSVVRNDSDAIIEETYSYERSNTRTTNENVGVSVEVGITQKIAYGGAASPVSGETGLSLAINTSYGKEWGTSNTDTRTASRTIAVPPKTELTVTQQVFKGNFTQRCEYWCDLAHGVGIWRQQDNGGLSANWLSMDQFTQTLKGMSANDITDGEWFRNRIHLHGGLNHNRITDLEDKLEIYYDQLLSFTNSTNGDLKVTSNDLSDAESS